MWSDYSTLNTTQGLQKFLHTSIPAPVASSLRRVSLAQPPRNSMTGSKCWKLETLAFHTKPPRKEQQDEVRRLMKQLHCVPSEFAPLWLQLDSETAMVYAGSNSRHFSVI